VSTGAIIIMDVQTTTFNLCAPFSYIMQSHYTTTPQMVANFNWETGFTHKNTQHTTQFFEEQNFLHCCH
jgi:hypothetical protein